MNRFFLCSVLFAVVSLTTVCQGVRIVFSANPAIINPGVTHTLTLRCALEDYGYAKHGGSIGKLITITRDEDYLHRDVARIAYGHTAVAGPGAKGATVTGVLSNNVQYLQVTWSYPGQLQAGGYSCEITTLEIGATHLKAKVQVHITGKSVEGPPEWIAHCKEEIAALKKTVAELKSYCQNEIDNLNKTVNDLKTRVDVLSLVHNENGTVLCTNSDSWGEKFKDRETIKEVFFKTPYSKTPQVIISTLGLDVDKAYNLRYRISTKDLKPTGFKVVCGTWWDTTVYHVQVGWTSSVA